MEKKIKAVIWDMGGVILRTEDWNSRQDLALSFDLSLRELHDLVFNSDSAKKATLGLIDNKTHWLNVAETLGLSDTDLGDFQKRFWAGDRLDETLVGYIRKLKNTFTTGLLSNAWSDAREMLTNRRPCLDAFHYSIFSCEIGLAKPDLAIYEYILNRCGVEPFEAIFVDDAIENIEAANRLGMAGIHFINADQAVAEVKRLLEQGRSGS